MIKSTGKFLFGWPGTISSFLLFSVYMALLYWPTSYWFQVNSIAIFDSLAQEEIVMKVDRTIVRPFNAEWNVIVRKVVDGRTQIFCTANGMSDYRMDSELPDPLTLGWWTDGACETLPSGQYIITTLWTLKSVAGIEHIVQVDSNAFIVRDKEVILNKPAAVIFLPEAD